MKKIWLALALAALVAASAAQAQTPTPVRQPDVRASNQIINAASSGSGVTVSLNNAQGCLAWTVTGLTATAGGQLSAQTSNDGGKTWSAAALLADAPPFGQSVSITSDGQYRTDTAGRTGARLIVTNTGVGNVTVAWNASSVPCVVAQGSPSPPATFTPGQSPAYEGHHQFASAAGGLSNFAVTIETLSGWLMLFDAAIPPPDGATASCSASAPPCLEACYYVKSDGVAGGLAGLWTDGKYLPFKTGMVAAFSINGSGCAAKTESASAWFRGDVQ